MNVPGGGGLLLEFIWQRLFHGCAASGGVGPEELPKIRRFSGPVLMALALCHAQKPFCPGEGME